MRLGLPGNLLLGLLLWGLAQACYLDPEWKPDEPVGEAFPCASRCPDGAEGSKQERPQPDAQRLDASEPVVEVRPETPDARAPEPAKPSDETLSEPRVLPDLPGERPPEPGPQTPWLQLRGKGDVLAYAVAVAKRPSEPREVVYVYGYFVGAVQFGQQSGAPALQTPAICGGCPGLFVAQFDTQLRHQWSVLLATLQKRSLPRQLQRATVDAQGGLIVAGDFESHATFYKGKAALSLTSRGPSEAFVAWIQPDGTVSEVKHYGSAGGSRGVAVAADPQGNTYLAGSFAGSLSVATFNLRSTGLEDGFVLKLDPQQKPLWLKGIHGPAQELIQDLVYSPAQKALYLAGAHGFLGKKGDVCSFDALSHKSRYDGSAPFVVKVLPTGSFVWLKVLEGPRQDFGRSVAVSGAGKSHLLASYSQQIFAQNDARSQRCITPDKVSLDARCNFQTQPLSARDLLLTQLSETPRPTVDHVWSLRSSANKSAFATHLVVDLAGNLVWTGGFEGTVRFPSPMMKAVTVQALAGFQLFVASYTSSGALRGVKTLAGTTNGRGMGLAVDSQGHGYVVGYFEGTGTLNGRAIQSLGARDGLLWKLSAWP